MRIGIDIDNIITNTTECVLQHMNEMFPALDLKMEDITAYWMESCIPEEYRKVIPLIFEDPKMWKKVRLIDGAARYIQKLYEDGHEIYFVTATTEHNFRKKVSFLTRSLPFLPEGYVKQHAISMKYKQLLNIDIMIDDYLDNLTGERLYSSICLAYPWNTGAAAEMYSMQDLWHVYWAKNWAEIYKLVCDLNNGW